MMRFSKAVASMWFAFFVLQGLHLSSQPTPKVPPANSSAPLAMLQIAPAHRSELIEPTSSPHAAWEPNLLASADYQLDMKMTRSPRKHVAQRVLAASYYSLKNGLNATLILSNQGPREMSVDVTLFSLIGDQFKVPTTTLQPASTQGFDMGEWSAAAGTEFEEGSVEVRYEGVFLELGGVVRLLDMQRSLIFDEELTEPARMFTSARLEGVWWLLSENSDLRVSVSNTTGSAVVVNVSFSGKGVESLRPEILNLAAHETRILDVREYLGKHRKDLAKIGGVSVTHSGPPGSVLARGYVQEPAVGFSNVVEFYDPEMAKSAALDGAGLRIGRVGGKQLTQIAVARNVGEKPTILTGQLVYSKEDGTHDKIDLQEMKLLAGETRLLDLAQSIKASGLTEVASAGLKFHSSAGAGSVVMSALSISDDGNQVFRVPLVEAESMPSSTGQYPWAIDNSSSTFVYLKNVTDEPQNYTMYISYEGGFYNLGLRTIDAATTVMFDLSKIRDREVPDVDGNILPREATHGQVHWSFQGHDHVMIGRVEQVDVENGISMTAACGLCCGDNPCGAWVEPGSVTGNVGDSQQFIARQQDCTCAGLQYPPYTRVDVNWSSSDTTVATCNQTGFATAVGAGQALIGWNQTYLWHGEDPTGYYCIEESRTIGNNAWCNVRPTVSISGPSNIPLLALGAQGSDSIQLTANPSRPGGTFRWTVVAGSSNVRVLNDTSQTAIIQSVAVGNATIQVEYNYGGLVATAIRVVTVQRPTSLAVTADTGFVYNANCRNVGPDFPPYTAGVRTLTYQVRDAANPPQAILAAGMGARETFASFSTTCTHVDPPIPGPGTTGGDGTFPDSIGRLCSLSCLPADLNDHPLGTCTTQFDQTWNVNGYSVLATHITLTCTSAAVQ